jgi:hypothetical protein
MALVALLFCALAGTGYSQSIAGTTPRSIVDHVNAVPSQQFGFQDQKQPASSPNIPYPFNIFNQDPFSEGFIDAKQADPIPPGINLPPELMELYSKFAHLLPQLAEAHKNSIKQIDYCNPQNPHDGRKCESNTVSQLYCCCRLLQGIEQWVLPRSMEPVVRIHRMSERCYLSNSMQE